MFRVSGSGFLGSGGVRVSGLIRGFTQELVGDGHH